MSASHEFVSEKNSKVLLHVMVSPRSSRDRVIGEYGGRLKIELKAAPTEGKANKALIHFLAEIFGVPKRNIVIRSGSSARRKTIELEGISLKDVKAILDSLF